MQSQLMQIDMEEWWIFATSATSAISATSQRGVKNGANRHFPPIVNPASI